MDTLLLLLLKLLIHNSNSIKLIAIQDTPNSIKSTKTVLMMPRIPIILILLVQLRRNTDY